MPGPAFRHCLVEEEAAGLRSQRARLESWLVSLLLQGGIVAALVLLPLVATGELPLQRFAEPVYIPLGSPQGQPGAAPPAKGPVATGERPKFNPEDLIFQPPRVPEGIIPDAGGDAPPSAGYSGAGEGSGERWGIPGGVDLLVPDGAGPVPPIPPQPKPRERITVGGVVQAALLVHRVNPVYPPLMKQIGREGTVVLRAIIGADGTVRALEVERGERAFARAAVDAVRQWRYRPTLLNGTPVEVETTITVIFTLRR